MVVLLVYPNANNQGRRRIEQAQTVILQRGNNPIDYHQAEIPDITIHRVHQKQSLRSCWEAVNGIKDCRQVSKQSQENIVQILGIPEKYKKCRQDHSNANIEDQQTQDWVSQRKHMPAEIDIVKESKQKEHTQHQPKIDQHRNVFGKQKQVFGNVDLSENLGVGHQRAHAALGGFLKKGHNNVARKQIGGKMRGIPAEQLCKDQFHHKQSKEWRQNAPPHA